MRTSTRTTTAAWQPPKITITRISIRTTAASHSTYGVLPAKDACLSPDGMPLGVAAGAARSPAAALEEMRKHAREVAADHVQRLIRQHRSFAETSFRAGHQPRKYAYDYFFDDEGRYIDSSYELSCEVIDVRMSPGQVAGVRPGWLAYGTVVATGQPDPVRYAGPEDET